MRVHVATTILRMTFAVQVRATPPELLDLEECMRNDPQVKGAAVKRRTRSTAPGDMGPAVDALSWVAENKELVGGLAAFLATWLAGRRTRIRVRVGAKEIDVTSSAIPDPEPLALFLLEALEDPEVLEEPDDDV